MQTTLNLISTCAAVVALFLIWRQLKHQAKNTNYRTLTELHQLLIDSQIKRNLRFIFNRSPEELEKPKSEEELEIIETTLNTYSLVGFRIEKGVLPENETLDTEWTVILRLYRKLRLFIEQEKKLRGGDARYRESFLKLVEMAEDYKRSRGYEEPKDFLRSYSDDEQETQME